MKKLHESILTDVVTSTASSLFYFLSAACQMEPVVPWHLSSSDGSDSDEHYWNHIRVTLVKKRGCSTPGRAANIDRGRQQAAERLMSDCFGDNPVYSDGAENLLHCSNKLTLPL